MFEVEKPRRFHYTPRFYDPEKEKWEALKKKYAFCRYLVSKFIVLKKKMKKNIR